MVLEGLCRIEITAGSRDGPYHTCALRQLEGFPASDSRCLCPQRWCRTHRHRPDTLHHKQLAYKRHAEHAGMFVWDLTGEMWGNHYS